SRSQSTVPSYHTNDHKRHTSSVDDSEFSRNISISVADKMDRVHAAEDTLGPRQLLAIAFLDYRTPVPAFPGTSRKRNASQPTEWVTQKILAPIHARINRSINLPQGASVQQRIDAQIEHWFQGGLPFNKILVHCRIHYVVENKLAVMCTEAAVVAFWQSVFGGPLERLLHLLVELRLIDGLPTDAQVTARPEYTESIEIDAKLRAMTTAGVPKRKKDDGVRQTRLDRGFFVDITLADGTTQRKCVLVIEFKNTTMRITNSSRLAFIATFTGTRHAIVFDGIHIVLKVFVDLEYYDKNTTASTSSIECGKEIILAVINITTMGRGRALTALSGFMREALAATFGQMPSDGQINDQLENLLQSLGL
ncbi:hypothetical protein F5X68DRAFT_253757, partial [Plectosphaerella plurivora]